MPEFIGRLSVVVSNECIINWGEAFGGYNDYTARATFAMSFSRPYKVVGTASFDNTTSLNISMVAWLYQLSSFADIQLRIVQPNTPSIRFIAIG